MKPRGVSWILAVVVGIFVILAISLSVAELPDYYSIPLQQSKAAVYDWFSSGFIDEDGESSQTDDYMRSNNNDTDKFLRPEGEFPTLQAQAPSQSSSGATEVDISVGGDSSDDDINDGWGAGNETSSKGPGPLQGEEKKVGGDYCDVYSGSWVQDESYPLFQPFVCPFIDTAFRCVENGRNDTGFLRWRWQPSGCNLPRFNATDMLRALRGKKLVFVGDSLGRNQWESLVCMLYQGVSNRSNVYEARKQQEFGKARRSYTIVFSDYKVIVEYYRSHFLVIENRRPPGVRRKASCSLTLDKLEKSSSKWKAGDVLVFNSGHWWTHSKVRSGKCYFVEGNNFTTKMDVMEAYEKSLRTWASWVDTIPSTKRVFFRGFAPSHFSGGDWDTGGTCDKHTQPLGQGARLEEFPEKVRVVDEVLKGMKTPVTLLNVTYLSLLRKDGHIANWGRPNGDHRHDCSHWCLPGVPDTWNHLLYAALLQQH